MTSETPEDPSTEQPSQFGSATPDSRSQSAPHDWATEAGQSAPAPLPGQPPTQQSDAGATPTSPWPQQGPWPQQDPWVQQHGQPAAFNQAGATYPAPGHSPSGQIPPSPHEAGQYQPGQYGPGQPGQYPHGQASPYPPSQHPSGSFPPGPFAAGQFGAEQLPPGQFPGGQFPAGQFPAGQYPGQYPPGQYPPGPFPGQYPPGQYPVGQYAPGPFGYPPQFYAPVVARNNPFAITALVCGIVQFVLLLAVFGNILGAIPAIVFGSVALKQVRERGERGRGMAIAGIVLGIVGILIFALIVVGFVIGTRASSSP